VQIWETLTELGADRKSLIINVGGGVVTDLGGFVASTFKRGIDFIHVPTTLLAMVDASVGGKNGIDLGNLKNQIGVINVPKMIIIDSSYLETLPKNEMRSGLAEMLKHGLIHDNTYWKKFTELEQLDFADFDALIYQSIVIKNLIVMQDPTENGIRKALNFGHTLGHAIELESKFSMRHGECVAIGMAFMAQLQLSLGLITEDLAKDHLDILEGLGLPTSYKRGAWPILLANMSLDKKARGKSLRFVTITGIGKTDRLENPDEQVLFSAYEKVSS
jgi:3-dehydroquinate synthase